MENFRADHELLLLHLQLPFAVGQSWLRVAVEMNIIRYVSLYVILYTPGVGV